MNLIFQINDSSLENRTGNVSTLQNIEPSGESLPLNENIEQDSTLRVSFIIGLVIVIAGIVALKLRKQKQNQWDIYVENLSIRSSSATEDKTWCYLSYIEFAFTNSCIWIFEYSYNSSWISQVGYIGKNCTIYDKIIKKFRNDLAIELKNSTFMKLE